MKQKSIIIILIFVCAIVALILSFCHNMGIINLYYNRNIPKFNNINTYGNTNSNVMRGSKVAKQGSWLFMEIPTNKHIPLVGDPIYMVSLDGKQKYPIIKGWSANICVVGEYLYYSEPGLSSSSYPLFRVHISGRGRKEILSGINHFNIYDGRIYYKTGHYVDLEGSQLYSCDLDGENQQLIASGKIRDFYIINNKLYYDNINDDDVNNKKCCLYESDLDGFNRKVFYKGLPIFFLIQQNDYFYFIQKKQLCKMSVEDKEITTIYNGDLWDLHNINEYLVVYDRDKKDIIKISMYDDSATRLNVAGLLENSFGSNMYVHDDMIYFYKDFSDENGKFKIVIYFIDLDGNIINTIE